MTMVGCISKVKKNFGVSLSMIAWLKTRDIMGSHSITCHPAEVIFPPSPQPKLVLD